MFLSPRWVLLPRSTERCRSDPFTAVHGHLNTYESNLTNKYLQQDRRNLAEIFLHFRWGMQNRWLDCTTRFGKMVMSF